MTEPDPKTLTHILDALDEAGDGKEVSVQDILDEIGERSIMPVVLAICILLVSPVSGIPGVPTIAALIMLTLTAQALIGRRHLWLPGWLQQRTISARRLQKAVAWMRRPCAWIDRHSHPRLRTLTVGPLRLMTLVVCLMVPLTWPFLELLPMVTSVGAGAVALMSFGLLTRDGLYVAAGYLSVGGAAALVGWIT